MFPFFSELPDEVVLNIFKRVSRQDLSRLAQVDARFNELTMDKSLELKDYKKNAQVFELGNLYLVFKTAGQFEFNNKICYVNYRFSIFKKGKKDDPLFNRLHRYLLFDEKNYYEMIEAVQMGQPELLIKKLHMLKLEEAANCIEKAYELSIHIPSHRCLIM